MSASKLSQWRISWRQVWILYAREFRSALRDRTVVVNSILIPLLLYPFMLWAGLSLMMIIEGQAGDGATRIAAEHWPKEHLRLKRLLEQKEKFRIVELGKLPSSRVTNLAGVFSAQDTRHYDILVEFREKAGATLPGSFDLRVYYDSSRDASAAARENFAAVVEAYRENWIQREAKRRGVDDAAWQVFWISNRDAASKEQIGAFLLGLLLPVIFAVMVATGCFYPAVDTLAGERERGTWETLLSTGAQRGAVLVAKFLHVASFGGLAGMLNLAAVMVTIQPILNTVAKTSGRFFDVHIPWHTLPLLVIIAILLAAFIGAGMMIFAAFARTFKEGQSMITPFYIVLMVPIVFLQVPGLKLSLATACVPVMNLILLLRAVLSGTFQWGLVALTILCSVLVISLALLAAAWILHFEEVATGSYQGNIMKFIREQFRRQNPTKEATR